MAGTESGRFRRAAYSRGTSARMHWEGDGLERFQEALDKLSSKQATRIYASALNHTGAKAKTRVIRALAKQVGLPANRLKALGRIRETRASAGQSGNPAYIIRSTGRYLPLGEFRPTQVGAGTKASPWGVRQLFDRAFIFAGHKGSGKRMPGGHVFVNTRGFNPRSGRNNLAIPLWGPSIPKELVQGASKAAFEEAAQALPDRVRHELVRLTRGAVT